MGSLECARTSGRGWRVYSKACICYRFTLLAQFSTLILPCPSFFTTSPTLSIKLHLLLSSVHDTHSGDNVLDQ